MTTAPPLPAERSPREVQLRLESARRGGMSRFLVWGGIALTFTLVLELTCRIEDWVMYRTPIVSRVGSIDDLVVRDADGMHARPRAEFQKWKVNSLGMRGPERPMTALPGTIRVITVGASETFGLRESPEREYPRQLEDSLVVLLNRGVCDSGSSPRIEVLNAAFAGMSLPTIEQDVRLRLRRLRPNVVVIYASPAQYLQEDAPRAAMPDSSGAGASKLPLSHAWRPRVVSRVREQLKQMVPAPVLSFIRGRETAAELRRHPPGWRFAALPAERLRLFDADLRRLLGTVRAVGARPVLVTHANLFMDRKIIDEGMLIGWEKFYPRASGRLLVAFDSAARLVTMRAGADFDVVTVDAASHFAKAPPTMFGDFVHFTDAGASLMADTVARGVLAAARERGVCQSMSSDTNAPSAIPPSRAGRP